MHFLVTKISVNYLVENIYIISYKAQKELQSIESR
jgi:hypothetical protein